MSDREALKSAVMFLTGACVAALLLHLPARAADATGYGGFKVGDSAGSRPERPPPIPRVRPPPPPFPSCHRFVVPRVPFLPENPSNLAAFGHAQFLSRWAAHPWLNVQGVR